MLYKDIRSVAKYMEMKAISLSFDVSRLSEKSKKDYHLKILTGINKVREHLDTLEKDIKKKYEI